MDFMPERAWVEINLDNIAENLRKIKGHIGENVMVNGVIKADGYGHGAVMTARTLCENGIDMLSVATLDEAAQLRNKDIKVPILVLGYTGQDRVSDIIENDVTVAIFNSDLAKELSSKAVDTGEKVKCHIKIDTGMNRVGFAWHDEKAVIAAYKMKGLEVKGTFTHYSTADEADNAYTETQYARFKEILGKIKAAGIDPGICHTDNSGGVILHPGKAMDMVRTGLLLYGLYPSKHSEIARKVELKNAMAFKAKIIQVKRIGAGEPVSYGNNYVTKKDTIVATIACGYADGYSRSLSGKTGVLINGEKAPLIGNICMDMCMADITEIEKNVTVGGEAVLFDGEITAGDIAGLSDTINYEIICRIGMRVPRVYIKDGQIVQISNYLL